VQGTLQPDQDFDIVNDTLRSAFAPKGTLRASINLGNPILANTDSLTRKPFGVSSSRSNWFFTTRRASRSKP
jgi:hypothetical protein